MYRRHLSKNELKLIDEKYSNYKSRGGFLTSNQKLRLRGKKKGDEGTTEADFWYRLKKSARGSIVDLQMICDIGDEEQIKEIFQKIPLKKVSKNESLKESQLVSFDQLIASILVSDWRNKDKDDLWKSLLVRDIMSSCLNYTITSGILMTKSHMRLVEEVRDLVDAIVSVSVQVPKDKREAIQF